MMHYTPNGCLLVSDKDATWSEPNQPRPGSALCYLHMLTVLFEPLKKTVDWMTRGYTDEDASERYDMYATDVQGVAKMEVHLFTLLLAVGNYRNDKDDAKLLPHAADADATLERTVARVASNNWEQAAKTARDNLIAAGWYDQLPPPQQAATLAATAALHQRLTVGAMAPVDGPVSLEAKETLTNDEGDMEEEDNRMHVAPHALPEKLKGYHVLYLSEDDGWVWALVEKDELDSRASVSWRCNRPFFADEPDGVHTAYCSKIIQRDEISDRRFVPKPVGRNGSWEF